MRIVIVEPYAGGSHLAWAAGYRANTIHDVSIISHEARFWKWRMQGAHLTLAEELRKDIAANGPVDLLIGTSMLNSAAFLGMVRRDVSDVPFVLYMHENQLSYPISPQDRPDQSYPMINWSAMAVADMVVFNSQFHHDDWFGRLPRFLRQFPDHPHESLIADVEKRSVVLPFGVDLHRIDAAIRLRGKVPRILWNQRWEYDKGPVEFARAMTALDDRGLDFDLIIAGEQFVSNPPEFERLRRRMGDRLVHYGWADDIRYPELLRMADLVVSTAHHEFFGIALTEAVYAGAMPVAPNRLVYPERLTVGVHGRCLYHDDAELIDLVTWALLNRAGAQDIADELHESMAGCDWAHVAPRYDEVFAGLG